MGCGTLIGGVILWIIVISAFFRILSTNTATDTPSPAATQTPVSSDVPVTPTEPPAPGSQWFYDQREDDMGKGTIHRAMIVSSNTVSFDFPYSGEQHARLTLRTHPRYGKDIIFGIEKGQILCHSYEDCTVLVRFDDKPPSNFSAVGAADNSTETIFIRNYSRFVENMLKASKVRISVNIYQEGSPVFEFDVSGFNSGRYKGEE